VEVNEMVSQVGISGWGAGSAFNDLVFDKQTQSLYSKEEYSLYERHSRGSATRQSESTTHE